MIFLHDQLKEGCSFRSLTILGDCNRGGLGSSIPAERVVLGGREWNTAGIHSARQTSAKCLHLALQQNRAL